MTLRAEKGDKYGTICKEKEKKDLMLRTNAISIRNGMQQELIKICSSDFSIDKTKLQEIPMGNLNNILSVVPNILASKTLSDSYRIIIPEGVTGNLMKYKTGLLGTPIVDDSTKKIIGHAGLDSLNPQALALAGFTAVSFVTGQYFMAKINEKLETIKNDLNRLKQLLEDRIISEVKSAIYFIQYADINMDSILISENHTIATLSNVQFYTVLLYQNSIYYEDQIEKTIKEIKTTKDKNGIEKKYEVLLGYMQMWQVCTYGFFYGKVVEIRLSQNYDKTYLSRVQEELFDRADFFRKNIKNYCESLFFSLDDSHYAERNFLEKIFGMFNAEYQTKAEVVVDNLKLRYKESQTHMEEEYEKLTAISANIENLIELEAGFELYIEKDRVYICK